MNRADIQKLDLEDRVTFLNTLRKIVGQRCDKNKAGAAMVSDFDMIASSDSEIQEALRACKPL